MHDANEVETATEHIDTDLDGSVYRRLIFKPSDLVTVEVSEIEELDGTVDRTFRVHLHDEPPMGLHDLSKALGQVMEIATTHV